MTAYPAIPIDCGGGVVHSLRHLPLRDMDEMELRGLLFIYFPLEISMEESLLMLTMTIIAQGGGAISPFNVWQALREIGVKNGWYLGKTVK